MMRFWIPGVLASLAVSVAGAAPDFARQVRPIFQAHCYDCHGPEKQKSGFRLDQRRSALKGGDSGAAAIIPHDGKGSPLIRYVNGEDPDMLMPPKQSGKRRLSSAEIDILKAWIDAGPAWPDDLAGEPAEAAPHWAFTPLRKPRLPEGNPHPVDAFIRAHLQTKELNPSAEADRRTLLRRLTYDLTGLPPTWDELDAFASDQTPTAYERTLERLLASPHYGEHWARHWLDVANYADTHGNDHDYARWNAWPYRDYVIAAFNNDKPYARFVQEQLAGDALFPDVPEATVALGFLAAGPWDHTLMVTVREDTVDHRMAQNLDRDNMVTAAIGTFQSLTIHCARCHDHKFDPITQREYYQLQAVFAGVDRADRPFGPNPSVHVQRTRLMAERRRLEHPDVALLARLSSPESQELVAVWEQSLKRREESWSTLEIVSVVSTGGAALTRQMDDSWFASGARPDRDTYIVAARFPAGVITAVRLQVLPDDRLPARGPGRWDNGNFHLTEFRMFTAAASRSESARPVVFARAAADYDEGPNISAAQAIDGKNETHWGVHPRYGESHEVVFELKSPLTIRDDTILTFLVENQAGAVGHGIGRFRLTATGADLPAGGLKPIANELAAVLRVPVDQRTPAQHQQIALAAFKDLNQQALAALPPPQWVYAVTDDFPPDGDNFKPALGPRPIHVLTRGDINKPGEPVGPGALRCVPGLSNDLAIANPSAESQRRAALALWLTDSKNALTWRSIVNRVWSYHFGRGLCDTPNDFGKMGGAPSHPELLDWLAVWFRDEAKGSFKALHRLILTSETWKQTSLAAHGASIDADNRLLWRQNRPRLTAEELRDTILALSGRLDGKMGGPAAIQFLERGNATFNSNGDPAFLDYEHFNPDAPAAVRRSVYRFLFRTVPDPFMDALDCPDGGAITPVRSASSTPLQAFALLNDHFLIRQCEHIAARLTTLGSSPEGQADALFRLVLLRNPRETERAKFAAFIQRHGAANAAQVLLNSSEFLYLD